MTLAPIDLAHAVEYRAYLVLIARWRRSRPRREIGAWAEERILAAIAEAQRERAALACPTCRAVTGHVLEADTPEPLLRRSTRTWRCLGCRSIRLQVIAEDAA